MEKRLSPLDFKWLSGELETYFNSLGEFIANHRWIDDKFSIDHVGIKAYDMADYEACLSVVKAVARDLYEIEMNNRRIAIAVLAEILDVAGKGIRYIELMEPRPEKVGRDTVGLDHTEIYVPDFETTLRIVDSSGEMHEYYDNGHHKALVFKIGRNGEEIKISDTPIEKVIEDELLSGELKKLK
jgi:predicted metalloenzyme YecM